MKNKNWFVRCCHFLLSIGLMLTAYEVKGGLSNHSFILIKSSPSINAISVKQAGVTHRTFSLGEGENFIIAEEVLLNGLAAQVHIRGTNYLTDYLFLTPGGRASVAADPSSIEQAEALHFSPCLSQWTVGSVETLLSDITTTNSASYGQQPCDQLKRPLSGALYINPSITRLISEPAEGSFTPTDDILVLIFSNTDKSRLLSAIDTDYLKGKMHMDGSYRLKVSIGRMDKAFTLYLPQSLIINPVASYYVPPPTPTVTKPPYRLIPSVKVSRSGQPEASSHNERTDADIAMAAYFYPQAISRTGSTPHPETYADTGILFIQRSGPADHTEPSRPNEKKAETGTVAVEFTPFAMCAAVEAAMKTRSEHQNATPKNKTSRETSRTNMRDTIARLKYCQLALADFSDDVKEHSLVNPEDIGDMVNYTRYLLQLRSNYIPGGKPADKRLINTVDEVLLYSRVITISFLRHLKSKALVTSGGLEGSDVLPAQLLAELCDGLQPAQPRLKTLKHDEDQIQAMLYIACSRILKLIDDLSITYRDKKPEFTRAVANAWQDLRRVISFLVQNEIIDLCMDTHCAWTAKHELSFIASEMGDIDTMLLLMQLTSKQLTSSGHENFFEIQRIFNITLNTLVNTLRQRDLSSANFTPFLNSARLLNLDTSQLEAAIKKHQQNRERTQAAKSQKISQRADAWAEKEIQKSDSIRQKMQEKQEKAKRLREKRYQRAKQHSKETESQGPALSTATASDLPPEKSTIEPDSWLSFYEQGEQAFNKEHYDDALQHYLNGLAMTSNPLHRARIQSSIADCYFFWGSLASRLRNQLTKSYDYYEDAVRAVQSGNYPELDKDGFFKLARSIIDAIDDKLIESIRQAYRWHVEAIDELQKLKGEEEDSEVEELLSLLIIEAENQEELARSIKDGVITLNKASELRRQAINNKKPDQRPSQRKEEKKVLQQLSYLQEKVTSQPVRGNGKRKGKKKRQTTQKENPDTEVQALTIEAELEKLKTGEAACQQELYDVLGKFSGNAEKAREIKRNRKQKAQHSETPAPEAPASGGSELSSPAGLHHYLEQSQLNELLSSSGIIGFNAVDVPSNHWCMFEALERWLNLFPDRDSLVNNPTEGSELFYALGNRAKLMADENQDDQMLNQIAATFHVDAPGPQAWGTDEMLHRLIAPVLNLNILVLAVDFSEGHPVLTSVMYTRDAITPVPPEERNSAINRSDTIALLHINNHWQAVLPAAGFVQPASTGSNATDTTANEQAPLIEVPGLHSLEILTPEITASQSQ
ncbi:hypothetical protein [Endozoicomonas euniceicola]|uniref:Tetratricopeptide repeat protein n=1 Tax=Endozoicomonas euniceicola TaxID=1234143 RepID=A0ABY6GUR4_9GAMM|nr:hypothetical protein [Endozoicomonas euniceicola]UYM15778.1 hypothetical protein NX720_23615 [Endozoicomonas euniceicola]